ncbi:MAG TPA: DUF4349 domain-containing protein [Methylotenera sp.]|nr:DUF4349 domain-containing protein [Methylotenera sp.]HPH05409.1 DUF4349 domain-containing protein [Methylotenera sp.]HPN01524.1 DUF4349 domain-containing protein [Methylotenera sp.]
MNKYLNTWALSLLMLCLVACGQKASEQMESASVAAVAPAPMQAKMAGAEYDAGAGEQSLTEVSEPVKPEAAVKRYIALRHALVVETSAEQMQAAFDATTAHCLQLNCQILMANYNRETLQNAPSASLSVRIPPRNVEIFLTGLAKNAEVLQHHRESEDKTNAVVDADARIKNLTEFRDNLRAMLSDKSAKFKDLIEVQRELVNTQSELDSIQSVRKILALETELVAVNIEFSAKQGITEQGFFSPVSQALKNAGSNMMDSVASVITFVMVVLPWLLLGIPTLLLARKLWARFKKK